MKYLPDTTLAYYQAAPHFRPRNLSDRPVQSIACATKNYREHCGKKSPDASALRFYCLNHLYSLVRAKYTPNEKLNDFSKRVAVEYLKELVEQSERMTHYMISIITREARHTKTLSNEVKEHLLKNCGKEMLTFIEKIRNKNEDEAVNSYMHDAPPVNCRQYVEAMVIVFNEGLWSGGYGGKPWGQIATTLLHFIEGKTSLEMMVDTAYTLAHNNGPMFNKGMMYSMYTESFKKILDIQRSGQIPESFLDTNNYWAQFETPTFNLSPIKFLVVEAKKEFPSEFGTFVDWVKVEQLGALGTYTSEKEKQMAANPVPVFTKINGKPIKATGNYVITPGSVAVIYQRLSA